MERISVNVATREQMITRAARAPVRAPGSWGRAGESVRGKTAPGTGVQLFSGVARAGFKLRIPLAAFLELERGMLLFRLGKRRARRPLIGGIGCT